MMNGSKRKHGTDEGNDLQAGATANEACDSIWNVELHAMDGVTSRVGLTFDSRRLSYAEVIELWRGSEEFRAFLAEVLREAPMEAFFWEVAPVTVGTLGRPFECVLVQDGGALRRQRANLAAFREHFDSRPGEQVVTFPNLGGDAVLVAPAPTPGVTCDDSCYAHLAKFLRGAPREQVDEFWRRAGEAMVARVSEKPVWLSTAGLGVPWLHLRLDSRPKYYRYRGYANADAEGGGDRS